MYAVIELGGRQWKVEPGTRLDVHRLTGEPGTTHTVERVLLTHDGQAIRVGHPYVDGAKVLCDVVEHRLGPKVISYHYRRRENWRKTVGHRQTLSRLIVKEVQLPDGSSAKVLAATHTTKAGSPAPLGRQKSPVAEDAGTAAPAREPAVPRATAKGKIAKAPKATPKRSMPDGA